MHNEHVMHALQSVVYNCSSQTNSCQSFTGIHLHLNEPNNCLGFKCLQPFYRLLAVYAQLLNLFLLQE